MVVDNLDDFGKVCSVIFLGARGDCRDLYTFHHKIEGAKISHPYNFNPVSITLWYENNNIIFSLSIIMDSEKWRTMSMMITSFSDSVLGNIADDTGSVSSSEYIIFGQLWSNLSMVMYGLFCPWSCSNKNWMTQRWTRWHDNGLYSYVLLFHWCSSECCCVMNPENHEKNDYWEQSMLVADKTVKLRLLIDS